MDLFEHQARELFEEHGIPVPRAEVTDSPKEAREIARRLGGRVVVKAQVKTGGRGKAGGVKLAADPAATELTARQILGMDIKGHTVRRVMVAEPAEIESEFYVSYVLDRAGKPLSRDRLRRGRHGHRGGGGDPARGRGPCPHRSRRGRHLGEGGRDRAGHAACPADRRRPRTALGGADPRGRVARRGEPLVRTAQGRILALDGKVTLDDNASFRQTRWGDEGLAHDDPLEAAAAAKGLNYVKLDGEVGVIGNGAGLVMSTLDVVAGCGARPANFLDIGGGASAQIMADGLSIILSDPEVKSVFVNVFGGITACDAVADGIVQALDSVQLTKPLVVRLDGNNAVRGRAILDDRDHPLVHQATTMDGAARRAADLAHAI